MRGNATGWVNRVDWAGAHFSPPPPPRLLRTEWPVSRGRSVAKYPLLHAPVVKEWPSVVWGGERNHGHCTIIPFTRPCIHPSTAPALA